MTTTSIQNNRPIVVDSELPSQTSATTGRALISNGVTASWSPILNMIGGNVGQTPVSTFIDAILPSQSGNAGHVLSTNGTTISWTDTGFSQKNLATTGYQRFPSGLIIEWGVTATLAAASSTNVTLPMTLPNTGFVVLATPAVTSGNAAGQTAAATFVSTNTINVVNTHPTSNFPINWVVIGF